MTMFEKMLREKSLLDRIFEFYKKEEKEKIREYTKFLEEQGYNITKGGE